MPSTSIQLSQEQFDRTINNIVLEKRNLYKCCINTLIEHKVVKKPKYLPIIGIMLTSPLVRPTKSSSDVTFGRTDSLTLYRLFTDENFIPTDEMLLDNTRVKAFAEIFAGIIDTRFNSQEADKMSKSKMLDPAIEGKFIIKTANKIISEHYDKIKIIAPSILFCFGQLIASPKEVPLIPIPQVRDVTLIQQKIQENIKDRISLIIPRIDSFVDILKTNTKQEINADTEPKKDSKTSLFFREQVLQRRQNAHKNISSNASSSIFR